VLRRCPLWFLLAVAAISIVGAGTRVAMVIFVHEPSQPGYLVDYDPIFYSHEANLVADGHGFIAPYLLDVSGRGPHRPSAGHPPLLVVALATASRLGARSFGAHRLVVALIGALLVPLVALLGAQVAGWTVGVIAASIAALYPNLWLYDGLLMSEALAGVLIALALVVSYRILRNGRLGSAAWLGVIVGLAALTRGELLLLVPLLVLPVCFTRRDDTMLVRARRAGIALVAVALVLAPWTIYNLQRFKKPVLISTAVDTTLGGANCDPVYYGPRIGLWTDACFSDITARPIEEDVAASEIRSRTVRYVEHHKGQLPAVVLARVGRLWDVYRPADNVAIGELERRPPVWSWIAFGMYAAFVPLAAAGAVILRRRREPVAPLLALAVLVTGTAAMFWGDPRFRRPAEIAIVVLAAVAIDTLGRRVPTSRPSTAQGAPDVTAHEMARGGSEPPTSHS
jgi:4-amino-4-deoxy-L-arabinose transferase-like glycosyltransferase